MAPKTRSSSQKQRSITENAATTGCQKKSRAIAPYPEKSFGCVNIEENVGKEDDSIENASIFDDEQKRAELDTSEEETESDSESVSSSSAEDSDDDYELEFNKMGTSKKSCRHGSFGDEDIVRDIEKKIERETKKKRIRRKENRFWKGQILDSEDVICEFESTDLSKLRRRRLYRRKMMATAGTSKRRRIKRPDMDVADDYTCDTLVDFGSTSNTLTTDVDWDDPEIDMRAAKRLFRELESEDEYSDQSEEDEADIIGHNLPVYMSRNSTERVSQIIELKVAPFSEKLACYNSSKAVHGATRSSIQCHHPSFLIKEDSKLPEELVWERPFIKTLSMCSQFDAHEKCNNFLNGIAAEQKMETEYKLLREIQQKINEKSTETDVNNFDDHDKFNDPDQLQLMDDDFGDFSMENYFYEPDIRGEEDYTFY